MDLVDWYDYGARFYDPQLARWHVPDLLAEYNFNQSPYNYCMNNPISFIDALGLDTLKRDPNTGLPNKNLDEVVCVGKQKKSRPSLVISAYGGKNNPYAPKIKSNDIWIDFGDMLQWINLWLNQKLFKNPGKPDKEDMVRESIKAASEAFKFDEEIVEETTGNNAEIIKNEIEKRYGSVDKKYIPQGEESDSVIRSYAIRFYEDGGHLFQDYKVHKHTNMGRPISKPYRRNK